MSDATPDEIMKAAQDLVSAEQIRFASAYGTVITDSLTVETIARALMAADEAATKLERERDRWQPIETAPKDGEGFLAYWPISETQWCIVTCWWKTTGAAGPGWHTVDLFDDDSERLILPTKWQPLPPPPAILKGEA